MSENYYRILGVSEDADIQEIKIAFRRLALQYHPDKNPDTKELFVKILKAYEVLSDPELKKQYDFKIKYSGHIFSINKNKEKKNKWEVTEEDEKRRQYYRTYFEKLKKEYEYEKQKYEYNKKKYNEWKYWIFAIFICFILFLLWMNLILNKH